MGIFRFDSSTKLSKFECCAWIFTSKGSSFETNSSLFGSSQSAVASLRQFLLTSYPQPNFKSFHFIPRIPNVGVKMLDVGLLPH